MGKIGGITCTAALALFCLSAQTPAPAPPVAKPLRSLAFSFSVHQEGLAGDEFAGMNGGIESATGEATRDGGSGTMNMDVLSIAKNGALVVKIWESVWLEPRARQAFTCEVYGNTTVICPSVPAPSPAEWVLLSYLGRNFVEAAPWGAQRHWQRTEKTGQFALREDFTMEGEAQAPLVLVREQKQFDVHGGFSSQVENVEIHYSRAMEVPDAIHDDLSSTLRSDSFAKP